MPAENTSTRCVEKNTGLLMEGSTFAESLQVACTARQGEPSRYVRGWQIYLTIELQLITFCGVDLFGPFIVKRGRTDLKRYGCIFTCLTVRAVHKEVVHSLDTDSFINALQRFICRRGQVRGIRSDNGSNFVCAAKELKFNQGRIHHFLRERSVEWSFNPPAASHMGGVYMGTTDSNS